jgi:hypothetical protein
MRLFALALSSLLCAFLYGDDSHISPRFQTVYIVEMPNEFDQHLASRLTASRVLWVVLDPASADAVLTDSLDESFLSWMQHTYGGTHGASAETPVSTLRRPLMGQQSRGTIFLVDPRRKLVLWSASERPKDASAEEADRTAMRLTNALKIAFGKK